jgi:hypothetical protein
MVKILINFFATKLQATKVVLNMIFYLVLECLNLPQNPSPDKSENPAFFEQIVTKSWK